MKETYPSKVKFEWPHRAALGVLTVFVCAASVFAATTNDLNSSPGWLSQPLSLSEALRIALFQNADIRRSLADLDAAHGIAIQTRAIVIPKLRGAADYGHDEAVESETVRTDQVDRFGRPIFGTFTPPEDEWTGSIRIHQSIYEGGRMMSALRTARLTKEQALFDYQAVVAETVLIVRTAYYNVLLAEQQILVRDASVQLLAQELENTKRRFEAGAVPRFDVLRGEVEVANARPKLIRAKNTYRTAKSSLATVLGYDVPTNVWDDIPFTLATKLETEPFDIQLPRALAQARDQRAELAALRREVSLHQERIIVAKAGYKPSLNAFAGYGAHNSEFHGFSKDVAGAVAGVSMTWDFFDGGRTKGRITEARANAERAEVTLADRTRRVDQEVRTAYSSFVEAREVLDSQKRVVEQAEEAIRLAGSRYEAGSGTQLDVLNAQTALTDARTTQVEAVRDYMVARARLERAIGVDVRLELDRQVENKNQQP